MPKRGADLLVESLIRAGVRHLFTLSGNQILSIYDATIGRDIRILHTRHEATAVHMADGWGRLMETPGVALVTAGPGHCNSLSALYVARMAESPMLLLSGHCPQSKIGQGAFQEIDQVAMATPVCKAAWMVTHPDNLAQDLERALTLAQEGRPGPVHLSLPSDVLEATSDFGKHCKADEEDRKSQLSDEHSVPSASKDTQTWVLQALDLLNAANRALILVGPALSRPHRWSLVKKLSERIGIPALPMESPRGVNDPWLHEAANLLAQVDVVLLFGKKLDFSLRFAEAPFSKEVRFIQIDPDEDQLSSHERVVLKLHSDPLDTIEDMTAAAQGRSWPDSSWPTEVTMARKTVPSNWEKLRHTNQQPIHPLQVCGALQKFLDKGDILISDGGEFGQWAQAGLEAQVRLINGPSGSIGSALPMAFAAKLAHPKRQVFVTLGDGAFGFHALDFDTAMRYELPIVAIVGNDSRWNAEVQLQIQNFGADRTLGCELWPSRYDKVVEALGGYGEFVERTSDLVPALERAVESGLPACLNVAIEAIPAPTFLH